MSLIEKAKTLVTGAPPPTLPGCPRCACGSKNVHDLNLDVDGIRVYVCDDRDFSPDHPYVNGRPASCPIYYFGTNADGTIFRLGEPAALSLTAVATRDLKERFQHKIREIAAMKVAREREVERHRTCPEPTCRLFGEDMSFRFCPGCGSSTPKMTDVALRCPTCQKPPRILKGGYCVDCGSALENTKEVIR